MKKVKVSIMLIAILVLSICVVLLNFPTTNAQKVIMQDENNCSVEKEGFKICVASRYIDTKLNQDVKIQVLLLNLSEKKSLSGYPPIYEYKAVNESGESLVTIFDKKAEKLGYLTDREDKTGWKRKLLGGSSRRVFIDPQDSQKDEVNLSSIYDFTTPSKYIVSIKRKLPSKNGNGFIELVIDKIEIEVKDENN